MTTTLPRRRTPQQEQAQVSYHQFSERMEAYGWAVGQQEADLGEDLIVHIYFDGRASGVMFHVQLKSMTRLDKAKHKPALAYKFSVHDLLHWEPFVLPVALVVWDINLHEDRWILVHDAIAQLDQGNPAWRTNKDSATVHIPHEQDTSDGGLARLRLGIARHLTSLLMGDGVEVNLQFRFPNTEQGRTESEKLKKAFEEGEPLDLDGQFIGSVEISNPVTHGFTLGDSKPSRLELRPVIDDNPRPFTIELRGRNGQSVEFENVLFRTTRSGTKRDILENDPPTSPVAWKITIWKNEPKLLLSISWTIKPGLRNVGTMHKLLRMMAVTAAGGQFVLSFPALGAETIAYPFEPYTVPEQDPVFVELVNNLYYAQNATGVSISIPEIISVEDIDAAQNLYCVLTTGYDAPTFYPELTLSGFYKADLATVYESPSEWTDERQFRVEWEGSELEVCGATVPLGPRQTTLCGRLQATRDDLQRRIDTMSGDDTAQLTLTNVTVTRAYPDWLPPAPPPLNSPPEATAAKTPQRNNAKRRNAKTPRKVDMVLSPQRLSSFAPRH